PWPFPPPEPQAPQENPNEVALLVRTVHVEPEWQFTGRVQPPGSNSFAATNAPTAKPAVATTATTPAPSTPTPATTGGPSTSSADSNANSATASQTPAPA